MSAPDELHALVWPAATQLRTLGPEPLAIACAPDKFNDSRHDDFWSAVQIGGSFWEQSQFFKQLQPHQATAKETTHLGPDSPDGTKGYGTSLLMSSRILQARAILNELELAGWREIAAEAIRYETILGLIIQFDQPWLWTGEPNGGDGLTYLLHETGIELFAEEDNRLDGRIGDPNLLRPEKFHPPSFAYLSAAARRQFLPELVDDVAAQQLHTALAAARTALRAITQRPVLLRTGATHFSRRRHHRSFRSYGSDQPQVVVNGVLYSRHIVQQVKQRTALRPEHQALDMAKYAFVDFEALTTIAEQLDALDCRALFETAFGVDTFDHEDLFYLFSHSDILIVHRTSLFAIPADGRIAHVGFLNRSVWPDRAESQLERIANLDPSMLTRL